jgi:hypothetical protein
MKTKTLDLRSRKGHHQADEDQNFGFKK